MQTKAAVAFEAKKPLEIVDVQLDGPRDGEVLVELKATGICHTDAFTLSGEDPEGRFPVIFGHEGAGMVREVGRGVTSVKLIRGSCSSPRETTSRLRNSASVQSMITRTLRLKLGIRLTWYVRCMNQAGSPLILMP